MTIDFLEIPIFFAFTMAHLKPVMLLLFIIFITNVMLYEITNNYDKKYEEHFAEENICFTFQERDKLFSENTVNFSTQGLHDKV